MATPQRRPAAPVRPAAKPTAPAARPAVRPGPPAAKKPDPAPAARKPSTAVAPAQTRAVASPQANVPDYIRQGTARGSENVNMEDIVIPRIELVQALSPCLKEGDGGYIEGAKPGMMFNSVTRELFPQAVTVVPVFFKKQYLVWKDRKKGGGFGGAYDSMEEASARIDQEQDPEAWEAIDTHQQLVLVLTQDEETGEYLTQEAVISMARTKQKISRQWNSLIRVHGMDRFSRMYELIGVDEQNSNGDDYKNFAVRYVDWTPVEVYRKAEALYDSIASGARKVKIDEEYEEYPIDPAGADPGPTAPPEY